jgi:hypothetical protein
MPIAHDCAEFRETFTSQTDVMSKAADPGKIKDANAWEVWSTSFANLLSVIPATSGMPADGPIVYNDFMEECVARHLLEGSRFLANRKRVHQLIRTFTQCEGSCQHIATNARHMNGSTDWLALLAFYGGSGNTAKMISKRQKRCTELYTIRRKAQCLSKSSQTSSRRRCSTSLKSTESLSMSKPRSGNY